MSTASISNPNQIEDPRAGRIFAAAFLTQLCMGAEILLRLSAASSIKTEFFDAVDPLTSGDRIGQILGVLFLGYAISNFLVSPFIDAVGIRRIHIGSLVAYLIGTGIVCAATPGSDGSFYMLWGGSLLQGLSWGCIESALNPLVVSLYPTRKVKKLNAFHAAFSLGMVLGAPVCMLVEQGGLGWRTQLAAVAVPAIIALTLVARVSYPPSERVANGVSFKDMFKYTLKAKVFYFFLFAMFLTAAAENVPANWMDVTLSKVVGFHGFWLVAFIYLTHLVVRLFAGKLHQHLGSLGILIFAAAFALLGVLVLSRAGTPVTGLFGALLFGIGTALMFPTTLAATSERLPEGGSLAIGMVASSGMLAIYALMPIFGQIFDAAKIHAAGGAAAFKSLPESSLAFNDVMVAAARAIFESACVLPLLALAVYFAFLVFERREKKRAHPSFRAGKYAD